MIPMNRAKTRGRIGGPEDGVVILSLEPLTITSERSGRVAKMEETWVVTLVTRGVTGFHPKTQFAC